MYTCRSTSKESMAKTVAQTLKLSVPETSPFQPTHPSIATTFYCLGQSLSPFTLQFSCIIINLYVYFCLPYGKRCSPGVWTSLLSQHIKINVDYLQVECFFQAAYFQQYQRVRSKYKMLCSGLRLDNKNFMCHC